MNRFFFGPSRASASDNAHSPSVKAEDVRRQLEEVLQAADCIVNDELSQADQKLKNGDSAFHVLCRGLLLFLRATLGLERDVMREAADYLATAARIAQENRNRAKTDPDAFRSKIYPRGTEFQLVHAQAQTMGALVSVLNESFTEALRGFYNLRQAVKTLKSILEIEEQYLATHFPDRPSKPDLARDSTAQSPRASDVEHNNIRDNDSEDEFLDANESTNDEIIPEPSRSDDKSPGESRAIHENDVERGRRSSDHPNIWTDPIDITIHSSTAAQYGMLLTLLSLIPPTFTRVLSVLGFRGDREKGLDLLWRASEYQNLHGAVASMALFPFLAGIIPAVDIRLPNDFPEERLWSLVRSMRTRYPKSHFVLTDECRMLAATRQSDIAVVKLRNVEAAFSPDDAKDEDAEEASGTRAAALMHAPPMTVQPGPSTMKSVVSMQLFERALCAMVIHDYLTCANSFLRCTELDNWSHALHFYVAAVSHIELYRIHKFGGNVLTLQAPPNTSPATDTLRPPFDTKVELISASSSPEVVEHHAAKAREYFEKVAQSAGKRRPLAGPLPYETFALRKIAKWRARARELSVDIIDAVGVSPFEEMIYTWGSMNTMRPEHTEESLRRLDIVEGKSTFSSSSSTRGDHLPAGNHPDSNPQHDAVSTTSQSSLSGLLPTNEQAILTTIRAAHLRQLNRTAEARALLCHAIDRNPPASAPKLHKNELRDSWPAPMARYELAVCAWQERYVSSPSTESSELPHGDVVKDPSGASLSRHKLEECCAQLDAAMKWGKFDLEGRMRVRFGYGMESLKKLGIGASG